MKLAILLLVIIGNCCLAFPSSQNDFSIVDNLAGLPDDEFRDNILDGNRIIGGVQTTIERFPWQLSFRRINIHICGASILSATRGLTAAHCISLNFPPFLHSVMAGSTTRNADSNAVITPLSRLVPHPQYNRRTLRNDIAVIWFANALSFGSGIRPIPIAPQGSAAPYGATAFLSGWGLRAEGIISSIANTLKYTTKPVVTNQQCNLAYAGRITDDMLCAGVPQGRRGACQGDSGGALVHNGVQIGIVSWSRGCGRPNFPDVYSRVSVFNTWIGSVV